MSNMSNMTDESKKGGYKNLIVYQEAVIIYDLNMQFCEQYMTYKTNKSYRTYDQMIQAARSGKQNIVEGSLEKSSKLNINLTSVARASFGELYEDYADFLRTRKLAIWDKNDKRVWEIRNAYKTNEPYLTYKSYTTNPESFANLMLTLISKENYLLDQMLRSLETKFVKEGGYTENLTKQRLAYRSNNSKKPY